MRNLVFIPIFLFLFLSCFNNGKRECELLQFNKTIRFQNELKKFEKLQFDTIIKIEKKEINGINYTTEFRLYENESFLWLLISNKNKMKDSILLNYRDNVEFLHEINSEFDFKKCEIKVKESNFNFVNNTEKTEYRIIKI